MADKKKQFKTMEVTRIKLNAEQAVLSCCSISSRAAIDTVAGTRQCWMVTPGCTPPTDTLSS